MQFVFAAEAAGSDPAPGVTDVHGPSLHLIGPDLEIRHRRSADDRRERCIYRILSATEAQSDYHEGFRPSIF